MNWLWGLIGMTATSLIKPGGPHVVSTQSVVPSTGGFDPASMLTFEETVAQMSRGYENTQRAVQFMDAKAGAVCALSLTILTFVSKMIAWVYAVTGSGLLLNNRTPNCCIYWSLALLVIAEAWFGGRCLYQAFMTIRPNALPNPAHFTTLFPARENAWKQPDALAYLQRVVEGESKVFLLSEFKQQLLAIGGLMFRKIQGLQKSISALKWQGLVAVVIGGVIGFSAAVGWLDKKSLPMPTSIAGTVTPVDK